MKASEILIYPWIYPEMFSCQIRDEHRDERNEYFFYKIEYGALFLYGRDEQLIFPLSIYKVKILKAVYENKKFIHE